MNRESLLCLSYYEDLIAVFRRTKSRTFEELSFFIAGERLEQTLLARDPGAPVGHRISSLPTTHADYLRRGVYWRIGFVR